MKSSIKYGIFGLLILLSAACSRNNSENNIKLKKVKDAVLIDVLDSLHQQEVDYFYSKVTTKYEDTARSVSFKTSIRLINDSLLNTLITYARIPVVNALISPDSVKISNKRDKCYVKQSLGYIKEQFGVDFTHQNVEEMILGLPLGFDPSDKYYQLNGTDGYVIGTHRKKDVKRNERKGERELITYYTISPDLNQLDRIVVESPADTTTIRVDYKSRELVGNILVPHEVEVRILTPRQEIKLDLVFKKVRVNEEESIHFIIPEDYGECE